MDGYSQNFNWIVLVVFVVIASKNVHIREFLENGKRERKWKKKKKKMDQYQSVIRF